MGKKLSISTKNFVDKFDHLSTKELLEELYLHKKKILEETSRNFFIHTSQIIKIGIELEFYILNLDKSKIGDHKIVENFISLLTSKLSEKSFIYKIEKEQGEGQIEIKTIFTDNLSELCLEIESTKSKVQKLAEQNNLLVSFDGQTFTDDCGNSMQFNISLHDKNGKNLYLLNEEILKNSIKSLLSFTNSIMIFLAPNERDYLRFDKNLNYELFKKGKYSAPINLSFGIDNRTCAIRIPSKTTDQKNSFLLSEKRLEYRIASANCDPYLSISAILIVLLKGLKNKSDDFEKIYGNAFEDKYNLKPFLNNYKQALDYFLENNIFKL
ncbi:MAG: hypothetical protein FJ368_06415 [Pelagibacterales bacterium]|nr:hypothetical protein [Pelagibacterales bacterium]